MKFWSIDLVVATALMVALLNSASAGFAPRPNAFPSARMGVANRLSQAGTFGPRDYTGSFHQRRDRRLLLDPSGDQGSPAPYPATDNDPPGYEQGAPVMNATPAAPAFGQIYAPSAGPKIIMIGARPRSAHFVKMPIVVYGTQVGRTY